MLFVGGRRRRDIAGITMLCLTFGLLLLLPACSKSNTQAPRHRHAGRYVHDHGDSDVRQRFQEPDDFSAQFRNFVGGICYRIEL